MTTEEKLKRERQLNIIKWFQIISWTIIILASVISMTSCQASDAMWIKNDISHPLYFTESVLDYGFTWMGNWTQGNSYVANQVVYYSGSSYICIQDINPSNTNPATDTTHFSIFSSIGATGAQGATGATGAQGPAGTNGTNGTNGLDGEDGTNGTTPSFLDVGASATNRGASTTSTYTIIPAENPIDHNGKIYYVYIYVSGGTGTLDIVVYRSTGTNQFSSVDTSTATISGTGLQCCIVDLDVQSGDYLGFYGNAAITLSRSLTGSGYWYYDGDQSPCTNVTFTWQADRTVSLFGTGWYY